MDQDIIMDEFDSDVSHLSRLKQDESICKQNGEIPVSIRREEEVTDISKMLDDEFSDEMLSIGDEPGLMWNNSYKREPSLEFESDHDSDQTCADYKEVDMAELPQSDIYVEEGINIHSDGEQNLIFLDNSDKGSDEESQLNDDFNLSCALSDHNYISRELPYTDIKNVFFGLTNIISDMARDPKKKDVDIDQVSFALETIKGALGISPVISDSDIKKEIHSADTSQLDNSAKNVDEDDKKMQIKTEKSEEMNRMRDMKAISKEDNMEKLLDINDNSLTEKPKVVTNETIEQEIDNTNITSKTEKSNDGQISIGHQETDIENKEKPGEDEFNEVEKPNDVSKGEGELCNTFKEKPGEDEFNEAAKPGNEGKEVEKICSTSKESKNGKEFETEKSDKIDMTNHVREFETEVKKPESESFSETVEETDSKKTNEGSLNDKTETGSGGSDQDIQDSSETLSEEFPENCSEPLECYLDSNELAKIIDEPLATNDELISDAQSETKTTNSDDNEDQQKLNQICSFAKRLVKSCEDFEITEKSSVDDFLKDVIFDFKNMFCKKNYVDSSVQTEYTGKLLSKRKQRKINEKEKVRLLEESNSSSDEFEKLSQESESDMYSSSEEDLESNQHINNNEMDQESQQSADAVQHSDSDGLDLTQYIDECDNENVVNKQINSSENEKDLYESHHPEVHTDSPDENSDVEMPSDTEVNADTESKNEIEKNAEAQKSDVNDEDLSDSGYERVKESSSVLNDEKLKMSPVVVLNKLTDDDLENYYDELREKEIDRLLNFKSLDKRRVLTVQYTTNDKAVAAPKCKQTEKLLKILKEAEKDLDSDESNTEEEAEVITEREYLTRCNENLKQQLINTTSSSSEAESELSVEEEALGGETDSSNDSDFPQLVDKFLEKFSAPEDIKEKTENVRNDMESSSGLGSIEQSNLADNGSENEVFEVSKDDDKEKESSLTIKSIENKNINDDEDVKKSPARINIGFRNRDLKEKHFDIKAIEAQAKDVHPKNESDDSDCEILHDSLITKPRKEKSLDVLRAEYEKRRQNSSSKVDESISLSSESASELEEPIIEEEESHKRVLKPMLRQDQLAGETRIAQKEENERIRRLDKKQEFMSKALKNLKEEERTKDLILDYNSETKTFIKVHPDIVKQLKEHQIEGVKFMYDACYGSVEFLKKHPGSGCILAHCMGLGKTLQLIALLHTVISNKELKTSKVLVLCPKSTVMNWKDEIQRWLGPINPTQLKVYSFPDTSDIQEKIRLLQEWSLSGTPGNKRAGCFLMGYEAFRTLVFYHLYKKQKNCLTPSELEDIKKKVKETLLHPGADLVICDEGHIIKNRKSAISTAVAEIKTLRRIILTGTPIQNNLKEYYSMVNFIKPSFLGTEREFANLYANPIKCGQHKDSSKKEIKIMKQRSFVLHKKLSKFVQRREAALLKSFLPEKYEYVVFIPMSDVQNKLYEFFLNSVAQREVSKGKSLITDYTCLRKIWTHPKVLENAWQNAVNAKNKRESKKTPTRINSDDEEPDDIYDSQTGALSVTKDWWRPLITTRDLEALYPSNKLRVMFEIIRMCGENGEKCLIFSAFVAVLNVVEYFMRRIHQKDFGHNSQNSDLGFEKFKGPWIEGQDYYRLDGRTPKTMRHEMVKMFNDPENRRARCFLISAKAGGQGINLIGANRVIILDTSWNPSNDQQNIFRIFRLGQKRECYVYRLLAMGTMEEKVYSRSVTKQAMSFRVVDEQQIDRHYSMAELAELYTLTKPNYSERPVPPRPKDNILASLLHNFPSMVFKYHEHDSLLENKLEQELSEEEKADAWAAYEMDLHSQANSGLPPPPIDSMNMLTQPGPGNFLPPYAGFPARGYPMGYPPGMPGQYPPSLMSPYNFTSNAILDICNMYENFPVPASPLLSRLNNTNHLNPGHQFPSSPNHLLPPSSNMANTNMMPPNMNNLTALSAMPPFNNLANFVQSTGNSTITSHAPVYSSVNDVTSYLTTPSGVDSYRRFLEANNPGTSLKVVAQQKANNTHQNVTPKVSSTESIPTSVITNSDVFFGQYRDLVEPAERSSPKTHIVSKTVPGPLHSPALSQVITSVARSSPINTLASSNPNVARALNMGVQYAGRNSPSTSTIAKTTLSSSISSSKPSETIVQSGNISVRSVNSINNASSSNNFLTSVTATPLSSLNKPPVTYPSADRVIPRSPAVSLHSSVSSVLSKEPAVINVGSNKPYGVVGQIQLSPHKSVKNTTNIVTTTTSANNSTLRIIPPPPSVVPTKMLQNKPSTSSVPKLNNVTTTLSRVPNNIIKAVNKAPIQPPPSGPHGNPSKPTHGNIIRTKIVNRHLPANVSPVSVISKQPNPNTSQSSIRPNHVFSGVTTTKVNPNVPVATILPAMGSKPRSQVLVSSTPKNKNSTISSTIETEKQHFARNNAALTSLSARNNLSIRPLENKFTNAGITISPGRKVPSSAIASGTSLLKETSRKRPAQSNITLMLPENSPISVRQVKRPKVGTPPNLGVRNTSDPLVRVQNAQGLTIVPRTTSQNNQRLPKEGKVPEVVEID